MNNIEKDMLNDIAVINNELVNTQRHLAKKNAEIKKMNEDLISLNNDLEQFTFIASHDLQEPLRMITGFMEILKTRYSPQLDEKANTYIDFALNGGKRMQEMIIGLLEFSKLAREKGIRETAGLTEIMENVQQDISMLVIEKNASILIESELPVLPVFKSGISQLFQNLLTNSIKFCAKDRDPVVKISAVEQEKKWLFSFTDNGIGLDPKNEKVFEIFGRAHSNQNFAGHGIGLAVCKKVVENHGGQIWVEAGAQGGSAFHFTLQK